MRRSAAKPVFEPQRFVHEHTRVMRLAGQHCGIAEQHESSLRTQQATQQPYEGLTMRTFETLGASKKLVTTNAQVRDYDFFDPSNILVIDRKLPPRIPDSFLETAYVPARADIYAKYSLQGWIKDVTDN